MDNAVKVTVKGDTMVIEMKLQKGTPSASGKTMVVASTHGNQLTEATVDGHAIIIGINAYYKA